MRLFAALLPPNRALAELASAVRGLRELPGADRLRWTPSTGRHITLAFYGQTPEEALPALHEGLARAARSCPPLGLRLKGGGRFGNRVLWAGVEGIDGYGDGRGGGDEAALVRLAAAAAGALPEEPGARDASARGEHRPFHPHLTLARSRDGVELKPFAGALALFEGLEWQATHLALLRSELTQEGSQYTVEESWSLGGSPGGTPGGGATVGA